MMDQQIYYDSDTESHKRLLWWLYLMHGLSMIVSLGTLSFAPLIINYLKRTDTKGSFLHSHHSWQICSFWWYIVWMLIGIILFITVLGIPAAMLIWFVAWVWKAYRLIRGFLDLNINKAMPV
jgi:uncharacterized membrane protein